MDAVRSGIGLGVDLELLEVDVLQAQPLGQGLRQGHIGRTGIQQEGDGATIDRTTRDVVSLAVAFQDNLLAAVLGPLDKRFGIRVELTLELILEQQCQQRQTTGPCE